MKNVVIALFVGLLVGAAGGFAGGIFVFPYLFPPPPVNEVVEDKSAREVRATAKFIHANPSDPVHYGRGTATIYDDLLHLESDFEVGPGPKFHVYLVPQAPVGTQTRVQDTMFVDLGRLKAFSGSQNYPIPGGVDLSDFKSVVIWCEQFNVLVSPAQIAFAP